MLKIGEFSKLSKLTVKALRFYEKEGLLIPASVDDWTGYRFYETSQLKDAAAIKAYRQLDLSVQEIRCILNGTDPKEILCRKAESLAKERIRIDSLISSINHLLEEKEMKYHVTVKTVPKTLVYVAETVLGCYQDLMEWIPSVGEECLRLNPGMKCAEPPYEFCEYPDVEYREKDIRVRHCEAVIKRGNENEKIRFEEIPETKVLSIFHKGKYENIGEAYAYILNYAKENGFVCAGLARECYIDGIWNKEDPEEWLTEIQLPVE